MRGYHIASIFLSLATSVWAASQPTGRTEAATMDPYAPIRNSALQFDLGVDYSSQPGFYGPDTGKGSDSKEQKFASAGSLTQLTLRVRHGFVASTEAILEIPYVLAGGDSRRSESSQGTTMSQLGGTDLKSGGFGDWVMGVKSAYEPWGAGGYFALVLPIGEALGTGAYTNGDGQINIGAFWDYVFQGKYQVMTNFVFGYDLPATNRQLDHQNSYSYYLRLGYELSEQKYRPYIAFKYNGFGDYYMDKQDVAKAGSQIVLGPGIDMNIAGDFSGELKFDYTLAGSGTNTIAIPSGWKVSANLKYFWFRF